MIVLQLQGLRATGWCDNCFLLLDNKTLREEGRERRSTALPEGPTYICPSFTPDYRPMKMFLSNEEAFVTNLLELGWSRTRGAGANQVAGLSP